MTETAVKPPLVILDRDGVINHDSDAYIKSAAEWIPIPGSLEGIVRLKRAGYRVVVASNQSGLRRGLLNEQDLAAIHGKMQQALAALGGQVDGIFFCPHVPGDNCTCRKPKPGLLRRIAARFETDLSAVPVIGDSWRDIQAAQAAGARPILVLTGNGRAALKEGAGLAGVEVYPDLAAAAEALLLGSDRIAR